MDEEVKTIMRDSEEWLTQLKNVFKKYTEKNKYKVLLSAFNTVLAFADESEGAGGAHEEH